MNKRNEQRMEKCLYTELHHRRGCRWREAYGFQHLFSSHCRFNRERRKDESTLKSYEIVTGLLQTCELKGFVVKARELVGRKCVPLLVLCYYNILEGKEEATRRQSVAVKRPCVTCIVTAQHIIIVEMAGERSIRDIELVKSYVQKFREENR